MICQSPHGGAPQSREALDARLRRFPRAYRRRLRKLAHRSGRLADLLYSFPALAFVLAAGSRPLAARQVTIRLVRDGASLATAAAALGVPMWLRRLPPEAFSGPLGTLPGHGDFAAKVLNTIPVRGKCLALWLESVLSGIELCDEAFAVWLASQRLFENPARKLPLLPLAAFAWLSRSGHAPAVRLIDRPWHGAMSFSGALEGARVFLDRAILENRRGWGCGGWAKTRGAFGYHFVPLLDAAELRAEGEVMRNCVATYAGAVGNGSCLIFSVRRGGAAVATLEVRATPLPRGAVITQLLGPRNAPAPESVKRAAAAWLEAQGRYPANAERPGMLADAWASIWRPYWEAKPRVRPRLEHPDSQVLAALRQETNLLLQAAH